MPVKDIRTKIISNEMAARDIFIMKLVADLETCDPGQFVMLRVPGGEAFLRRPFGIVMSGGGVCEICYKVVGRGTRAMSQLGAGTEMNVMGPCGVGFDVSRLKGGRTAVLVAGGYGIAPLVGLYGRIVKGGCAAKIFYGAKCKSDLVYLNELKKSGADICVATEDGSAGERGLVTDALSKRISDIADPVIFACGPHGLLVSVAKLAREKKIGAQISLESHMACGIGVCLGCACKDKDGNFVRICKEGPVFDASEIRIA